MSQPTVRFGSMENALNVLKAMLESEIKMYGEIAADVSAEERTDHEVEINSLKIVIKLLEEEIDRCRFLASL